jgi:long-chain acyl-CoA synthetase
MVTEIAESPWHTRQERLQHRSAKRDAVLQAAARLFTQRGFQGTSLDDIAQSLRVTKPTLYHYVQNKEEILFECVQRGLQGFRAGIDDLALRGLDGRARMHAVLRSYAGIVTSDFGLCAIRVGEDPLSEPRRRELRALKGQTDAAFHRLIEQGMAQGWIEPGDVGVAVCTVVGALCGIGHWYRAEDHATHSLNKAVNHCIEMLMQGALAAPTPAGARNAGRDHGAETGAGNGTAGAHAAAVATAAIRRELHFADRVVRCFVQRPTSLAQMLMTAVDSRSDAPALVCDGLRLSWRELHHAARKCAAGLLQRGVQPGDRVALHLGNGPEFVIATLACAWMGAVLVPIGSRAHSADLEYTLNDCAAVALICSNASLSMLPKAHKLPSLRLRIGADVEAGAVAAAGQPCESLLALMQCDARVEPHAAQEEDLAVLLYTSGTTGKPKGAMLTHLNIAHSVLHFAQAMSLGEHERSIVAVPLSHVTGLVAQLYTMLFCRGCVVLMPQFKASDFVQLAARERISHAVLVPAMYNLCLLLPDLQDHDLRAWRIGAFGGAPMPQASIEALAERLPKLTLMNAYGATETCSPATIMPPGCTAAHRDSVGQAVACGELQVVDENGRELPPGEVGEIWIGGPMVVPGYWRNEQATASEFRGGYWRSGDIGSIDAEGYVRILDRKKDVINRGGYKVFCVQVENALAEHPQVLESALVGVPCAVLGERVHAFVCVRQIDDSTSAPALSGFCAARVADYAVPETWTIGTEPLPRNLNGKIMKRELRLNLHRALS